MSKFAYPAGTRFWADGEEGRPSIDDVKEYLNSINEKFFLGIVDCQVYVPENNICPLLSVHSPSARLIYPTGNFRVSKQQLTFYKL